MSRLETCERLTWTQLGRVGIARIKGHVLYVMTIRRYLQLSSDILNLITCSSKIVNDVVGGSVEDKVHLCDLDGGIVQA